MTPPAGILYLFHHRLPDPRAAAIFAVEEITSLSKRVPITVVLPLRNTTNLDQARREYHFSDQVELVGLPILELSSFPVLKRFAFHASIISFAFGVARYVRTAPHAWVVTTDHLPALVASWCGKRVMIEIHDFPTRWNPIWRLLLKRADVLLSTNNWKTIELTRRFGVAPKRIYTERNGVNIERFGGFDKQEARKRLQLPTAPFTVVYTGNLYSWKGVDTLIAAAEHMPEVTVCIVGGTADEQAVLSKTLPANVRGIARVPFDQMPLWQAAADVLVLPNTAREELSVHFTSPMKLFEYMASKRPIVASDLPTIREILPEDSGFFFTPDDPQSLVRQVARIRDDPTDAKCRAERARVVVSQYAWSVRAQRVHARLGL